MSVHVRGVITFLGKAELENVLLKTSLHFEGGNTTSPTVYNNLPEAYNSRLLNAIVAFEVEVKDIKNVFKLSQNQDPESYQNIIDKLEHGDADARAVAAEMKKRSSTYSLND
jgi:transcriptional regulator